jgi:hypothetical protein
MLHQDQDITAYPTPQTTGSDRPGRGGGGRRWQSHEDPRRPTMTGTMNVHYSLPYHIKGREQAPERGIGPRRNTRDWGRDTRAHSCHWEKGRRNSGQFLPATALTRRGPRTLHLSTDLRYLGRSSLSRLFVTPLLNTSARYTNNTNWT